MPNGVLLLGAGFARRFGSDKRLATLGDSTVAAKTIAHYVHTFDDVHVVVRNTDDELKDIVVKEGARHVTTDLAHLGMGHSLVAGMQTLTQKKLGWLVVGLLDMPFIRRSTLTTLSVKLTELSSNQACDKRVVRFQHNKSKNAHPIAWHHSTFDNLLKCNGDQGAKEFLQLYQAQTLWLNTTDDGVFLDIDQPQDLPTG